jgi:hypothetical protein
MKNAGPSKGQLRIEQEMRNRLRVEIMRFVESEAMEHIVPARLTKSERKVIHEIGDELLLFHQSREIEVPNANGHPKKV